MFVACVGCMALPVFMLASQPRFCLVCTLLVCLCSAFVSILYIYVRSYCIAYVAAARTLDGRLAFVTLSMERRLVNQRVRELDMVLVFVFDGGAVA